jgi:hypothetical protein
MPDGLTQIIQLVPLAGVAVTRGSSDGIHGPGPRPCRHAHRVEWAAVAPDPVGLYRGSATGPGLAAAGSNPCHRPTTRFDQPGLTCRPDLRIRAGKPASQDRAGGARRVLEARVWSTLRHTATTRRTSSETAVPVRHGRGVICQMKRSVPFDRARLADSTCAGRTPRAPNRWFLWSVQVEDFRGWPRRAVGAGRGLLGLVGLPTVGIVAHFNSISSFGMVGPYVAAAALVPRGFGPASNGPDVPRHRRSGCAGRCWRQFRRSPGHPVAAARRPVVSAVSLTTIRRPSSQAHRACRVKRFSWGRPPAPGSAVSPVR